MSLQINGRRSVFDMNDTNAQEEGEEVLEALGRRLGCSGWALGKMFKRLLTASDEEESLVVPLTFMSSASNTGTDISTLEAAAGVALTDDVYPYSSVGGGADVEVLYNGDASAKVTIISPKGDSVDLLCGEDDKGHIRLPVVNGTILRVTMAEGGTVQFVGNPDDNNNLLQLRNVRFTTPANRNGLRPTVSKTPRMMRR